MYFVYWHTGKQTFTRITKKVKDLTFRIRHLCPMKNIKYLTFLLLTASLILSLPGMSRDGIKLYSISNNLPWNSTQTWSTTNGGNPSGLLPQSNDTIVVNKTIILNVDFTFSTNGMLIVDANGLLKAENLNLSFISNSQLECIGEIRINNLSFSNNSVFNLGNSGQINVFGDLNSVNELAVINGKLQVQGTFTAGELVKYSGIGTVQASLFLGNGNIFGVAPASVIPGSSILTQKNWIGMQDQNWANPSNWADNQVPESTSNISILHLGNKVIIEGSVICSRLFINTQAELIIMPLSTLQINNLLSVTNTGKLTLRNTANERASLITNGAVVGNISSEYPVVGEAQDLISSPVKSAPSGTFLNMYLRAYSENNSQWGDYITPTNTSLNVMQGYELQSLYNETRIFEGTPNSGALISPITASGNGLNLTGNPYPCYIDWEDNTKSAWQREKVSSAIYYPDPNGSGNYAVYLPGENAVSVNNGSRFIKPMQGFFVKAKSQGSIVINENSRKPYLNDSKLELKNNSIRFQLTNSNGKTDEAIFRVIDNASIGFDDDMDAIKISGNPKNATLFFTDLENTKLAINTVPFINSSSIIPISVTCVQPGTYTLSTSGAFDFEYRYPVLLKDKQLNTLIDLRNDSSYSFQHSPSMNSNRFELIFVSPEGIEEIGVKDMSLTQVDKYVHIEGSTDETFSVNVFDLNGKLIGSTTGVPANGIDVEINTNNRIILVQLSNSRISYAQKLYFRN